MRLPWAKIIRRIYGKFLLGMSAYQIAKELTEAGAMTPMGGKRWHPSTVDSILGNEKYKGDALLQKTYTVDYLGKKAKKNGGNIPQYYVRNNHEAIISRDTFDLVQRLWEQRKPGINRITYYSVFSCKIVCGDCGSWYGRTLHHPNTKYACAFWRCIHKYYDKKCTTRALKETDIQARFLKAANQMITDRDRIISVFREALAPTLSTRALEKERATLEQELSSTVERIEAFLRENARRGVVQKKYQQDYAALTTHFEETKARIRELTDTITEYKGRKLVIRNYLREMRKKELLTEFRDRDWQTMVDHMTVYSKDDIRITFKDGTEIKT